MTGTFLPRGSVFIDDALLLVCNAGDPGRVHGWRRIPGTLNFINLPSERTTGPVPFSIRPTRDRTRVVVTTRSTSNVEAYYVEPEGLSLNTSIGSVSDSGGASAVRAVIAPDQISLLTADSALDRINLLALDGANVRFVGEVQGVVDSTSFVQLDVDPGSGDLVAVGTQNGTLDLYQRTGGVLTYVSTAIVSAAGRVVIDLQFQP